MLLTGASSARSTTRSRCWPLRLTARDETDLDALTGELAWVVQETLQPEGVSVWLKEFQRSGSYE